MCRTSTDEAVGVVAATLAGSVHGLTPEASRALAVSVVTALRSRDDRAWLMARVEKDANGCWLWTKGVNFAGYGVSVWRGRTTYMHRAMYEEFVGPIPTHLRLDHLCRVRRCVNPAHLEPVTQQENILRGEGRAAFHARKTHCLRGHLLSGENLGQQTRPGRVCKTCIRERLAERKDVVNARRRERAAQRRAQVAV